MHLEKRWFAFFCVMVSLWLISITSTLYIWISGITPLVGTEINLSYFTLPLLSIIFFYAFVSIFISCVYLLTFNKVKNYQVLKISEAKKGTMKSISKNNVLVQHYGTTPDLCSIIIPSSNEESVIRKTVNHCLSQTHHNIEVIVICHNCNDNTFYEAQVKDSRVRVFDLRTKEAGKGIALNEGVKRANGKYILILDSDGMLSRDFIENALPMFDNDHVAVQGRYVPTNRNHSIITKLLSLEGDLWSTPYMTVRSIFSRKVFLGGTGYIIRKDVLNEVGNFSNHLVDDFELSCRLLKKKYSIAFAPLSINYDEKPPSFEIMLRQRARWAKGFISLLKIMVLGPRDVLGNIYWLTPIATLSGLVMLMFIGFDAIHNMLFGYYLYNYAYVPLQFWFVLVGTLMGMQSLVLVKQYGLRGLKYSAYLPLYNLFSIYVFSALLKGFFVKSWTTTKTAHGFTSDRERQKIELQEMV
jgi:cellulose synthase/poly-beta-1,6-N-acetylglucosamine synthase-like glycosyltransferase